MLKPYVVVAAALSVLVVPVIGAQLAVAAETSAGLNAPVAMPNATTSPVPSGMSHGKGTTTESSGSASEQASSHPHSGEEDASSPVPSGSPATEDDMAGMDDQMPGMSHGKGTTTESSGSASEQASSHPHSGEEDASGPRPVAALVTGFAAINGGVLLIAAATRRRDKRLSATSSRPVRPAK